MAGVAARTLESMVQLRTIADPLGEALYFLRLSGTMYSSCELTAPWGLVPAGVPGIPDVPCRDIGAVLARGGGQ